jgi:hypothetical protein
VSLDLVVVAAAPDVDEATARALIEHWNRGGTIHVEGDLDERIVGLYEDLRTAYPDFPPYDDSTPWSNMRRSIRASIATHQFS